MKAFFVEFGSTIVVVIVIAVMILTAVRTSTSGGQMMENTYTDVSDRMSSFVDEALAEMDKALDDSQE